MGFVRWVRGGCCCGLVLLLLSLGVVVVAAVFVDTKKARKVMEGDSSDNMSFFVF